MQEKKPRLEHVHVSDWPPPKGYSNGVVTSGRLLHIAGQIGWNSRQELASPSFAEQFAQALDNVLTIARAAGAGPKDVARMTVYVTDLDAYRSALPKLRSVWRERFEKHYPAMALLGVAGLVEPNAKVEIEAVAVLPEEPG